MGKETVGEQIISMRSHASRCKRTFLTTLKKRVKKLKTKTDESPAEIEKMIENVKKSRQIVSTFHIDEVSELALRLEKKQLMEMKDDDSLDIKERLRARIALKKEIQNAVSEFRQTNPTWKDWIDDSIEAWEKLAGKKQAKLKLKEKLKDKKAKLLKQNGVVTETKKKKAKKTDDTKKAPNKQKSNENSEEKIVKKTPAPSSAKKSPKKTEHQASEKSGNIKKQSKKSNIAPGVEETTQLSNNIEKKKQKKSKLEKEKQAPSDSPVKNKKIKKMSDIVADDPEVKKTLKKIKKMKALEKESGDEPSKIKKKLLKAKKKNL